MIWHHQQSAATACSHPEGQTSPHLDIQSTHSMGVESWHNRVTSRCKVHKNRHQVSDWVGKIIHTLSLEYGPHFPWGWSTSTAGSGPVAALTGIWHQALPPMDSHPHLGFLWGLGLGPASPAPPTVFTSHPATNTPCSVHKSPSYKHPLQCSQVTQLAPPPMFTSHPALPAVFTSHPASLAPLYSVHKSPS